MLGEPPSMSTRTSPFVIQMLSCYGVCNSSARWKSDQVLEEVTHNLRLTESTLHNSALRSHL
jgi:hypothetical protein